MIKKIMIKKVIIKNPLKLIYCPYCGERYIFTENLSSYREFHDFDYVKVYAYQCQICGKKQDYSMVK